MKVKIFTEGGVNIGLGHISRCSSLYTELEDRGIPVELIVNGDNGVTEALKEMKVSPVNWLDEKYLLDSISSDDYAIVDSYKADKNLCEIISQNSKKTLFIDDLSRIVYPKGLIVNPTLDIQHIDYSKAGNNVILSGPEYVILRKPFRQVTRSRVSNQVQKVLIVMGGTDIRGLTPLIIENICKKMTNTEFEIIVSTQGIEQIKRVTSKMDNIKLYTHLDAKEMMALMINSDLAITAAGQTIYELLATHTPFIPIQVAENQKFTVGNLLSKGIVSKVISWESGTLMEELVSEFKCFQNLQYRKNHMDKNANLIDGKGSQRIIDALMR